MFGIYFIVIIFALLALARQRMSAFSVDLTFFLELREFQCRHKGVKSICFRTALKISQLFKEVSGGVVAVAGGMYRLKAQQPP